MKAYELAKAEVGIVEWKDGNNPKVVAYFKDSGNAGVKDDETAWCAAFVGAMINRSGGKGTGALNARSYLDWGVPVARKDAKPGDVVIFKRGNSSWQGHVAFFVQDRGARIDVLGGNQSDAVNVKGYPASSLLGIRRAKPPVRPEITRPVLKLDDRPVLTAVNENKPDRQPPPAAYVAAFAAAVAAAWQWGADVIDFLTFWN